MRAGPDVSAVMSLICYASTYLAVYPASYPDLSIRLLLSLAQWCVFLDEFSHIRRDLELVRVWVGIMGILELLNGPRSVLEVLSWIECCFILFRILSLGWLLWCICCLFCFFGSSLSLLGTTLDCTKVSVGAMIALKLCLATHILFWRPARQSLHRALDFASAPLAARPELDCRLKP